MAVPGFAGRGVRRHAHTFLAAYRAAGKLPDTELPTATLTYDGPPPARALGRPRPGRRRAGWSGSAPRWRDLAAEHNLPVENLLTPDLVRRVTWEPPPAARPPMPLGAALSAGGARPWQVGLTAAIIADALAAPPVADPADPDAPDESGMSAVTSG